MKNIFTNDWPARLERQFFEHRSSCERAYICSPLAGSTDEEVLENICHARAYMLYVHECLNVYARAPHAYLPMLVDDNIVAERALALQFGLRLLEQSDLLFVCGNRISPGMRGEIEHAASLEMPILTFHEDTFQEAREIVQHIDASKLRCVTRNQEHFILGFADPIAFMMSMEGMK